MDYIHLQVLCQTTFRVTVLLSVCAPETTPPFAERKGVFPLGYYVAQCKHLRACSRQMMRGDVSGAQVDSNRVMR